MRTIYRIVAGYDTHDFDTYQEAIAWIFGNAKHFELYRVMDDYDMNTPSNRIKIFCTKAIA